MLGGVGGPLRRPGACLSVGRHFHALVSQSASMCAPGAQPTTLQEFESLGDLPRQDAAASVEVDVEYSGLNYKDGLILEGRKGVVREFPIVPGIDYAGTVSRSSSPLFAVGDPVVLTGNKSGQWCDGGYAQRASCVAEWLVRRPVELDAASAMTLGTAGLTAMMCIQHLERFGELAPSRGRVLVTGAGGGVGQLAVALLAARGYEVIASTGRADVLGGRLRELGASQVIGRLELPKGPLGKQAWAGVVDTVGGDALAAALAQTSYGGAVASTGVAGGGALATTVYPLILRGIRVLGVDSTLPWDLEGCARCAIRTGPARGPAPAAEGTSSARAPTCARAARQIPPTARDGRHGARSASAYGPTSPARLTRRRSTACARRRSGWPSCQRTRPKSCAVTWPAACSSTARSAIIRRDIFCYVCA